jgi:hypothetical protein
LYEFDEAGGSIEPVFRAVCQDQRIEDDPANLDPAGVVIGYAFEGELFYFRLRSPRDVTLTGRGLAPQITKELYAPDWHWRGEIVMHGGAPIKVVRQSLILRASQGRPRPVRTARVLFDDRDGPPVVDA